MATTVNSNNIESKNNQEFFTKGKKYRCIKSVVMKKGGKTAFKAGNIYEQSSDPTAWCGWLTNDGGESRLCAGDWDDKRGAIEFCESGTLEETEREVREELDRLGFENYTTIDGEEMWV